MKPSGSSPLYAVAVIIALVLGVLLFQCRRQPIAPAASIAPAGQPVTAATPPASNVSLAPVAPMPTPTPIAIQDGKTIDYSSGRAVVRDDAKEQAIIDAAVKEMTAASAGVTFGPAPTATPLPAGK